MKRNMRTRIFRESSDEATLLDIEKTYGKKAAMALDKYCKLFKKNPTDVVSDLKEDGNGMTEWDKFDVWAKRKLKLDIMDNFDDTIDWTGAEDDRGKSKGKSKRSSKQRFGNIYDEPSPSDIYGEDTDSDAYVSDLLEKIGDYLVTDYGVKGLEKYKFGPRVYFEIDGQRFYVEVGCKN